MSLPPRPRVGTPCVPTWVSSSRSDLWAKMGAWCLRSVAVLCQRLRKEEIAA